MAATSLNSSMADEPIGGRSQRWLILFTGYRVPTTRSDGGRAVRRNGVRVEPVTLEWGLPRCSGRCRFREIRQEQSRPQTRRTNTRIQAGAVLRFQESVDERDEQDQTHRIRSMLAPADRRHGPHRHQRRHLDEPRAGIKNRMFARYDSGR